MCEKDSKKANDANVSVAMLYMVGKVRMADLAIRIGSGNRSRREAEETLYLMGAMDVLRSIMEGLVDGSDVIEVFEGHMREFIDATEKAYDDSDSEEVGNVD